MVVIVDAVEIIITTLHKTTRSTRSIMWKDKIKKKMFVKVLFRILKLLIINVAPKGTGLECVKHRSTFISFTRHPWKKNKRKWISLNMMILWMIQLIFMLQILLMILLIFQPIEIQWILVITRYIIVLLCFSICNCQNYLWM